MTDSIAFKGRRHKARAATRVEFPAPIVANRPIFGNIIPSVTTTIGGTSMAIGGVGFVDGATVDFYGVPAQSVQFVSSTQLNVVTPPLPNTDVVPVTIRNPDGIATSGTCIYEDPEMINGFRLTAQTGTPLPTSGIATSTAVYMTPYLHGRIALYNGTYWQVNTSESDITLNLGTLTSGKNYDVFAYANGTNIAMELSAAWSSDTARTDSLARLSGVLVKASDTSRRYIGTFRTISTTQTTDTETQRFVWNMYNRIERFLLWADTTATWTYNSATVRQARATSNNRVEFVAGESTPVHAYVGVMVRGDAGASLGACVGIGLDVTNAFSAGSLTTSLYSGATEFASEIMTATAEYDAMIGLGYHALNWNERSTGAATVTFFGLVTGNQSHMRARLLM